MTNHDDSSRFIGMKHDNAALNGLRSGFYCLFCDGRHDIVQGIFLPWSPFCHDSHGMSHAILAMAPMALFHAETVEMEK